MSISIESELQQTSIIEKLKCIGEIKMDEITGYKSTKVRIPNRKNKSLRRTEFTDFAAVDKSWR